METSDGREVDRRTAWEASCVTGTSFKSYLDADNDCIGHSTCETKCAVAG